MKTTKKRQAKGNNTISNRLNLIEYLGKFSSVVEQEHKVQVKLWRNANGIVEFINSVENEFFEKYFLSLNERQRLMSYAEMLSRNRSLPKSIDREIQQLTQFFKPDRVVMSISLRG